MPRKVLKCVTDVQITTITCPGMLLPSRSPLSLRISMFELSFRTKICDASFPLLIFQSFRFEKVFDDCPTCFDPDGVSDALKNCTVRLDLIQFEPDDGEITLATYRTTANHFLFPVPTLRPAYSGAGFDILMNPTVFLLGRLSPRLGYSTSTAILESNVELALVQSQYPEPEVKYSLHADFDPTYKHIFREINRCDFGGVCTVCKLYWEHFGHCYSGHYNGRRVNDVANMQISNEADFKTPLKLFESAKQAVARNNYTISRRNLPVSMGGTLYQNSSKARKTYCCIKCYSY